MAPSKNSLEVKLQRQITAAIAASADLETALGRILRAAVRLCGAHMGWISLFTGSGQELEIAAALGTKISVVGQRVPLAGSLSGLACGGRGRMIALPLTSCARPSCAPSRRTPKVVEFAAHLDLLEHLPSMSSKPNTNSEAERIAASTLVETLSTKVRRPAIGTVPR